ncbi:MAG: ribulose-phosphate 3-epimerase [Verrucomicrobia bacterium]|nr:ribulose-phosphate 3-epimerase [Verrucomicrobiota bacterium]
MTEVGKAAIGKQKSPRLSVGILTADMMNLGSEIGLLEKAGLELLHFDVMDGAVWPRITVGPGFVAGLKTKLLKDVHLLVREPEKHIEDFAKAGADIITFSVKYCADVRRTLGLIGDMKNANDPQRGILKGLSLNPQTPVDSLASEIHDADIVMLLAVGPESGKQSFIADLPGRIAEVKRIKKDVLIVVDGAIKTDNIKSVAAMGPDIIVTGSAVFDGKDPAGNLHLMMQAVQV